MTVNKLFSHLYVHLWVRIHIVKQLLVVDVLLIPLQGLVVAEVISQRDKKHLAAVEFRLFTVLIQEQVRPDLEKETKGGVKKITDKFLTLLKKLLLCINQEVNDRRKSRNKLALGVFPSITEFSASESPFLNLLNVTAGLSAVCVCLPLIIHLLWLFSLAQVQAVFICEGPIQKTKLTKPLYV